MAPAWTTFQHTAARRRLALFSVFVCFFYGVSTHSRPKAAGTEQACAYASQIVSTHSRPKAAGGGFSVCPSSNNRFNTQPPEGGWGRAYRMLAPHVVSTHSRPKAAGRLRKGANHVCKGFNTQPPEGGWLHVITPPSPLRCFNTQPPEGGW